VRAILSVSVQTGTGAHPASCTVGTEFFSPRVKRPEGVVDHPPLSNTEVKEGVELYLYVPSLCLYLYSALQRYCEITYTAIPTEA